MRVSKSLCCPFQLWSMQGQRCHNQLILRGGTSYVKAGLFPAYSFHNEEIQSLLSQVVLT